MKFIYLACILLAVLIIYSCKSQKINNQQIDNSNKEETKNTFFIIGSGGGFTGKYNHFKVHNSGKVEKLSDETKIYESYSKIEKYLIANYFKELEALNIGEMDYDHPGNMTFFIQVVYDSKLHTIKWGDIKYQVNNRVELFYEKVMTEIYKKER